MVILKETLHFQPILEMVILKEVLISKSADKELNVTTIDPPYQYEVFGITIESEIQLSGLTPSRSERPGQSQNKVAVRHSSLQNLIEEKLPGTEVYNNHSQELRIHRLDDGFFLHHEEIGLLRASTNAIEVSPNETAVPVDIEWLVKNLGLRLVLVQRGYVVFHASAVVIDDSLVAFAGPSGRGKSTLAAACYAVGHTYHSDDLVPFTASKTDNSVHVPPGPAQMRVNHEVVRSLQLSECRTLPDDSKSVIDTSNRHSTTIQTIEVLYLLQDGETMAINNIPIKSAVFELLRHSYALYDEADTKAANAHLEACGQIARSIDVREFSRPRSLRKLSRLVDVIEQDLSK